MKTARLIIVGLGIPMGIVAAMIVLVMLQRLLGYYPGLPGWEVAEIAAARKDVSLCKKILDVPWNFVLGFGPSSREMRADCIHDYAKLTKDPSVCELLMPSSYGLSCVGTALGNFESCPLGNNRETEIDGNIVSLKKCIDGNAGVRDSDCCKVAKARFLTGFDDCNISTPGIRDECNYELSFKNNDPGTCASISGAKVKSACEIAAGALQKDPSICVGCIKPVNSVDELGQ